MTVNLHSELRSLLLQRALTSGGFQEQPGGMYRPDATAWSIVALAANGEDQKAIEHGRQRLAREQRQDGRISISINNPEASWPTALAVLAWQGESAYKEVQQRAAHFLINTAGLHWPRQENSPLAHDTSIRGWPWVDATHSWVEPTALALMALHIMEETSHPRSLEAVKLLRDRQLSIGGWNYGNTRVFEQELRPMQESTGLALQALAGYAEQTEVEKSLRYLESKIDNTRTPFSLAWGILGLSAWRKRPKNAIDLIAASLDRQHILGDFPTTHLSLLLLAALAEDGLLRLMKGMSS